MLFAFDIEYDSFTLRLISMHADDDASRAATCLRLFPVQPGQPLPPPKRYVAVAARRRTLQQRQKRHFFLVSERDVSISPVASIALTVRRDTIPFESRWMLQPLQVA